MAFDFEKPITELENKIKELEKYSVAFLSMQLKIRLWDLSNSLEHLEEHIQIHVQSCSPGK